MQNLRRVFPALIVAALLLPVAAQDAAKSKESKAESKAEAKARRGRLPNYYGRIGVSDEQREEIYAIQAEYDEQIDALLQQIEELREQRDAACEAVLTDSQREELAKQRTDAAARRKARRAKKEQ